MYYLTDFGHFVSILSTVFDQIDPLFHSSQIFLTPYFYETFEPMGSNLFHRVLNPVTDYLVKYPCPPGVTSPISQSIIEYLSCLCVFMCEPWKDSLSSLQLSGPQLNEPNMNGPYLSGDHFNRQTLLGQTLHGQTSPNQTPLLPL